MVSLQSNLQILCRRSNKHNLTEFKTENIPYLKEKYLHKCTRIINKFGRFYNLNIFLIISSDILTFNVKVKF